MEVRWKEDAMTEKQLVELPTVEEIKEWISEDFAHLNPKVAPFFYMGIEALYVKLGGRKFIGIR